MTCRGTARRLLSANLEAPQAGSVPTASVLQCKAVYGLGCHAATNCVEALPRVRGALEPIWGTLPPSQFTPMLDELRGVLAPYRAQSTLLGLVTICSLPIAALGLMSALAHSVQLRRREIAVRMTLGAEASAVRRYVVNRMLAVVAVGIAVGTLLGVVVGSFARHLWFQVEPVDPPTIVTMSAGLLTLGWLATVVPVRRAVQVDPAETLRQA